MNTKHNNRSSSEPVVVTSIRMTPDQHEALKLLAASRHRTVSQELRLAIDNHLAPLEEAA